MLVVCVAVGGYGPVLLNIGFFGLCCPGAFGLVHICHKRWTIDRPCSADGRLHDGLCGMFIMWVLFPFGRAAECVVVYCMAHGYSAARWLLQLVYRVLPLKTKSAAVADAIIKAVCECTCLLLCFDVFLLIYASLAGRVGMNQS
ncbi:hypothetical protein Nepgr_026000 [Nepenthes gracilis]|uniref:Uncharacterized protein n=1 Tax=Nepenthes gracilis TaxID=150966 RepID=A0AAD3T7H1_NEPGR|nr:hypothetical protein Nepgr_026000 [Nepenthes gracilis]